MNLNINLKELSFLVYGLGTTGKSVVNFFRKNNIKNYYVWDDFDKNLYKKKRPKNLKKIFNEVSYIVLSPGVNLRQAKNKKNLVKYKKKIITDIDLIFLLKKFFKSVVVTGTNGKSTTCQIINFMLKNNGYKTLLGGNIGVPVLNLKMNKNHLLVIEASSFQLAHSKFITPDYAILLNITNDHIDWHGSMRNYINSKLKIFKSQKKSQFAIVNKKFKLLFKKRGFEGKLITPNFLKFRKVKPKLKNDYLSSEINEENMSNVFALSKIFNISERSFLNSLNKFVGLPHRYEIFLKKNNYTFINDSKATSFQASKYALKNTKNVYWILGGLPKKNDKIILGGLQKNIIKSYIIGKNVNFFKKQIKNKIKFVVSKTLKNSIIQIFKDIKSHKIRNSSVLLSPSSASYDQFLNFERRGDEFKRLCKFYAREYF